MSMTKIKPVRITHGIIHASTLNLSDQEIEDTLYSWKAEHPCVATASLLGDYIEYSFLWWATSELIDQAEKNLTTNIR